VSTATETPAPPSQSTAIRTLLGAPRTAYNRAEMSECGIGYLREYADHRGWSRDTLARYLRECLTVARDTGATADGEGLAAYLRGRRAGRGMLPSCRAAKVAAFGQLVGRGAL